MQDVFEVYPVDTIYVVDGMPFLNESDAKNHSAHTGAEVKVVKRDDAGKQTHDTISAKTRKKS
jgi:hypothetical protein